MDLERAIASRSKDATSLSNMLLGSTRLPSNDEPMSDVKEILQNLERRTFENKSTDSSSVASSIEIDYSNDSISDDSNIKCADCWQSRLKDRGLVGPLSKEELLYIESCDKCRMELQKKGIGKSGGEESMETDDLVNDCATSFQKTVTIGQEESVPEDVIRRYRLSLEEIREIPRFKDYSPGELNKVHTISVSHNAL